MALLGSALTNEVGLRLLLCPLGSNIVIRTACCTVGIGIPVYSTFKAIERKDQDDQQKWLTYWAAYGSFSVVEIFADKLISWFPFYYHAKFAFLVWLQLPTVEGSKQIYRNHLRPFLLRHQSRVDHLIGITYDEMARLISAHQTEIQFVKGAIMKIFGSADQTLRRGVKPDQPGGGHNAIEAPPRAVSDTESEHED